MKMPQKSTLILISRVVYWLAAAAALFSTLGFSACSSPSKTTTPGGGLRIQTFYNAAAVNGANFLAQYWAAHRELFSAISRN
jgi:hypothetical protein